MAAVATSNADLLLHLVAAEKWKTVGGRRHIKHRGANGKEDPKTEKKTPLFSSVNAVCKQQQGSSRSAFDLVKFLHSRLDDATFRWHRTQRTIVHMLEYIGTMLNVIATNDKNKRRCKALFSSIWPSRWGSGSEGWSRKLTYETEDYINVKSPRLLHCSTVSRNSVSHLCLLMLGTSLIKRNHTHFLWEVPLPPHILVPAEFATR